MITRDEALLALRPIITSIRNTAATSKEERFQNDTLRPVIKLQSDLLMSAFSNYVRKHKNVFYEKNVENRLSYIENAIQRDIKFRNSLKGMVIGQFTLNEYEEYITNSSALNKRMMNIVIERLQANIQAFAEDICA